MRLSRRRVGIGLAGLFMAAAGTAHKARAAPAAPATAATATAATAGSAEVLILDYKFMPAVLSVKRGTRVKWTNMEKRTTHSILFTGPQGFESERLFPGESWERLFDQPGLYRYTCGPHPEMIGLIEVLP